MKYPIHFGLSRGGVCRRWRPPPATTATTLLSSTPVRRGHRDADQAPGRHFPGAYLIRFHYFGTYPNALNKGRRDARSTLWRFVRRSGQQPGRLCPTSIMTSWPLVGRRPDQPPIRTATRPPRWCRTIRARTAPTRPIRSCSPGRGRRPPTRATTTMPEQSAYNNGHMDGFPAGAHRRCWRPQLIRRARRRRPPRSPPRAW